MEIRTEEILLIVGIITVSFAFAAFYIFCYWRLFQKADQPGWFALIPLFNMLVVLKLIGRPWWWLLLMLIPPINVLVSVLMVFDVARVFGKRTGFAFGLLFFSGVFLPLLALGDAEYTAPAQSAFSS